MSSTSLEVGLINTFRTGHVLLDAVVCLLVPILIQWIRQRHVLNRVWTTLVRWVFGDSDNRRVIREIETRQRFNQYGLIWDHEQRSLVLQKAVSLYLAERLNLKGKTAKVELVEKPHESTSKSMDDTGSSGSDTSCSSDDGYESDDYDYVNRVYRGEVYRLKPSVLPPLDAWIEIEPGVDFMHEIGTASPEGEGKDSKISEITTTFLFRSSLPDASKRIDAIVRKAFAAYQAQERKRCRDDPKRYFYVQSGTRNLRADEEDAAPEIVTAYKRYPLGEDKCFDNLFFKDKPTVLKLLDDFTNKTGKFAIRGFPYKLGLLLHGPPGTGKTSLIKAIAEHTKRHIVTINLAAIKTNQELMDAVFDLKFAVQDQDWPVEMSFKDVVFVMEDVDCAAKVVAAREKAVGDDGGDARLELLLASQTKADGEIMAGPLLKPTSSSRSDKLNMSGLLNVLDGVVDCPGRIVILTTNHPEKLDPALIRPGRVNKQLLLDYMGRDEMQEMVEYYCLAKMTDRQSERLASIVECPGAKRLTPAEIEEICAEFDDVESVLLAIQTAVQSMQSLSAA
jgi:mitochondrial chaperone BCS1